MHVRIHMLHTCCMVQVDLYTCFPIAAQAAAREFGLNSTDGRKMTLIGGLMYLSSQYLCIVSMPSLSLAPCASLCLFVYLCASMCYTYSGRCRYNGGPGANTAMHSLAAMVPKLRRAAGSYGASVSLCLSVCLSVSLCVSLCLSVCLGAPGVQRRV